MTRKITLPALFIISACCISMLLLPAPSWSKPGESDDPLVSKSYLQAVNRLGEIKLIKNDEFQLETGTFFILVVGKAEIKGVGDYKLIDLTSGKSAVRAKALEANHLCVISGGSNVKIIARDDVTIMVNGGEANLQRRGM